MGDVSEGAVYLSNSLYTGKTGYGVKSMLCTGAAWDSMLDFIKDSDHNVTSSNGWGNYTGKLSNTGATESKNIYDVAGNCCEWTTEAERTPSRVLRGGSYNYGGSSLPASIRISNNPTNSLDYTSFRPLLYVAL